ncbi:hypothetical protein GCM10022221_67320 [Actinocorallia aurea]
MNQDQIARQLRKEATERGWSPETLVDTIVDRTGVGRLRARRLAKGVTLQRAADDLTRLRGATVTKQQLSDWELARKEPGRETVDLLCRYYETRPDLIGYGGDYSTVGTTRITDAPSGAYGNFPDGFDRIDPATARELDEVRDRLEKALASELSETAIGYLEERVRNYDAALITGTSGEVVADVAQDIQAAFDLLNRTRTPSVSTRLLAVISRLSGTLGILMLHLGNQRGADRWFLSGQLAAEQTERRDLRAWIAARRALTPLYYGNVADAVKHANQALAFAGPAPSAASVRALTVRARAMASHPGSRPQVLADLANAEALHQRLPLEETTDGILGITRLQVASYLGEVYTTLGEVEKAETYNSAVLSRFAGHSADGCLQPDGCLDYALAWFSQARGHAVNGDHGEAATVISGAVLELPLRCRTTMVLRRASDAASHIPASARTTAEFTRMRDVLAFHASR